jgi:hypothetical protein
MTSMPATLDDVLATQGVADGRDRVAPSVGAVEASIRSRRERDRVRLVLAKVRWKRELVRQKGS